jgi:hypothetical protein
MIEITMNARKKVDLQLSLWQILSWKALHTVILTSTEMSDEKNRLARKVVLGDKKNFDVSRTLLMHKAAAFDITPKTPANVVIITHHQ